MARRYIAKNVDGSIAILEIVGTDPTGAKLNKALFEFSRTTDMATHFDPAVHTRSTIAAGLSGHRPLSLTAECEDTDLPTNRYFRNAWEWID